MFPAISVSFSTPRHPRNFSRDFHDQAQLLGFKKTRFHDLRGIHSTALLDAGIPVHTVAQRIGDDPAVLLRNYTKRKRLRQASDKPTHLRAWPQAFSVRVRKAVAKAVAMPTGAPR